MINQNEFKEKIAIFSVNFNFEVDVAYSKIILHGFESNLLDQHDFDKAFSRMMLKQKSEFYGRPALGDWIEASGKSTWVDRLSSYKLLSGESKERYLKFIGDDIPELHRTITTNDKLMIGE